MENSIKLMNCSSQVLLNSNSSVNNFLFQLNSLSHLHSLHGKDFGEKEITHPYPTPHTRI